MHSDLALASLPSFLTQIPPLFSPLLTVLVHFLSTSVFPERHHLSVSGYNFCQYYLYLPFCSAPGEHVDTQRSCQPWQRMKKEKSTSERRKRPRPVDYRRPFSLLVQRHLHQTNPCLIFSEGLRDSSFLRGECFPNIQFKWWRALCSTHKPFQTAEEMLLER